MQTHPSFQNWENDTPLPSLRTCEVPPAPRPCHSCHHSTPPSVAYSTHSDLLLTRSPNTPRNSRLPGRVDGKLICGCITRVTTEWCYASSSLSTPTITGGFFTHSFFRTSSTVGRFAGSLSTICFTRSTAAGETALHPSEEKSISPRLQITSIFGNYTVKSRMEWVSFPLYGG